jgi:hypothetical protein
MKLCFKSFTVKSLELKNGPNKLECYITLDWKGLQRTNTLAYRANCKLQSEVLSWYVIKLFLSREVCVLGKEGIYNTLFYS